MSSSSSSSSSWNLSQSHDHWELNAARLVPVSKSPTRSASQREQELLSTLDVKGLESELQKSIRGEVRFDDGTRAIYATDGSNYRQVPIGVVVPRDADDVIKTFEICRKFQAPILARGGGTSLAGQCCNVAVVLDFSKYMNQIVSIDVQNKSAKVMPGLILDHLRDEAEKQTLTFGPDPSTHNHCTLGGMIGNNSCGTHAMMSGRTSDNVHELDILTYDGFRMRVGATSEEELERIIQEGGRRGEIYSKLKDLRDRYADLIRAKFPKIPRRVSGYNLDELLPENGFHVARALVGTEGTCVTILEAKVRLVYSPPARSLLVLGYPDVFEAADHVPMIRAFSPVGLEGLDETIVVNIGKKGLHPESRLLLPDGKGWLMVEFGGETQKESDLKAHGLMERLRGLPDCPSMKLMDNKEDENKLWEVRKAGLGATAQVPGEQDTWEGWEDSAVAPDRLGKYLRDLRDLYNKYDYRGALYGHFGQACVHTRINFDLLSEAGIKKYRSFITEAADLVVSHGGSLSGEHGDGQSRAEFLHKMFGDELIQAFREFKAIWDPQGRMNPGKVVDPYRIDENLRLGAKYNPAVPETHFKFPEDQGSLARAALRCVGVGECRRTDGATMCPSFMVTREEKHSTRGRARLLHEMLRKDGLKGGWKSEPVKEALDLCLACKGCKSDCPMGVDMATYKAEFLSHYYDGRPRPRSAYAMGFIDQWAKLASRFPSLVNKISNTPGLRDGVKRAGGIDPRREMPQFARLTFKEWFKRREPVNVGHPGVLLWPDTFNNHFRPQAAAAAVEVLEQGGFQVLIPEKDVCCGRPLYDFGFLDQAKDYLASVIETLRPWIQAGIPLVSLEPSCASVFKDELKSLFPNDMDGQRLSAQTYTLAGFMEKEADRFKLPELKRDAILHGHCHQKSIFKAKSEQSILKKLGLKLSEPEKGCCGMAGSFGFESQADHYEVSMKIAERHLLPAVREASSETLLIADGFSCQTQIQQGSPREALHLAEVLHSAMKEGPHGLSGPYPEKKYFEKYGKKFFHPSRSSAVGQLANGAALGALAVSAYVLGEKIIRSTLKTGTGIARQPKVQGGT